MKDLRVYAEQINSNLDNKVLSQNSCQDQLATFFQVGLGNLTTVHNKDFIFSNPFIVPYIEAQIEEDESPLESGKTSNRRQKGISMSRKSENDDVIDDWRKIAFDKYEEFKRQLKLFEKSGVPEVSQLILNEAAKKGEILLSPQIIETLIYKGNTLLNSGNRENMVAISEGLCESGNFGLIEERLEALRKMLVELKRDNPDGFQELLENFYRKKETFETVIQTHF